MWGYCVDTVPLPPASATRPGFELKTKRRPRAPPQVVAASAGCHVRGAAQPHAHMKDIPTLEQGARKRVGPVMPQHNHRTRRRFKRFVQRKMRQLFKKLPRDTDVSFETWIALAPYPAWRKKQLWEAWESLKDKPICYEDFACKSFIKDEHYPDWKHARTINSRSDRFKVFSGPIFHAIEKVIFASPYFIKKIPAKDRAQYIIDNVWVPGRPAVATDYSSFEASFTREVMESCEMQLYRWMSEDVDGGREWYKIVHKALTGKQKLIFLHGDVVCRTLATRMSGDMCTSLGNGFTNLMVSLFLAEEQDLGELRGVFEGDDGLVVYQRGTPDPQLFADLGFNIKLEVHSDITKASFCGLVFNVENGVNCVDPSDLVTSLGWVSCRYARARDGKVKGLLRAKALSMAHQYPNAPVVCRLAAYALRVTRSIDCRWVKDAKHVSQWERDQLLEAAACPPCVTVADEASRVLVEEMWGWSVEYQKIVERYLDGLDDIRELDIDVFAPQAWISNSQSFVDHQDPKRQVWVPTCRLSSGY